MTDRAYRLELKYLGAPFEGWQSQPGGTGVQDHVEKALRTMLRHDLRVTGAARTDSGVHAEHQVATFRTAVPFDERRWLKSLAGLLPDAVGVTALAPVDEAFHPILDAKGKAYRYCLWLGATRNPHVAPYCWELVREPDLALMRAEAKALEGRHDFTSFCAVDSGAKTRERTVIEVALVERAPLVEIWVTGEGFLKQMVRTIVGTLVDVGAGRLPPGCVPGILAAKDRTQAGATAPAQGLTLARIFYGDVPTVAGLRAERARDFAVAVR